jgi:hypothetical protein
MKNESNQRTMGKNKRYHRAFEWAIENVMRETIAFKGLTAVKSVGIAENEFRTLYCSQSSGQNPVIVIRRHWYRYGDLFLGYAQSQSANRRVIIVDPSHALRAFEIICCNKYHEMAIPNGSRGNLAINRDHGNETHLNAFNYCRTLKKPAGNIAQNHLQSDGIHSSDVILLTNLEKNQRCNRILKNDSARREKCLRTDAPFGIRDGAKFLDKICNL